MVNFSYQSPKILPFWSPSAVGTYVLAFVCVVVRSGQISKSVQQNFLIFGTKLELPNSKEVNFAQKSRLAVFGLFRSKKEAIKKSFGPIFQNLVLGFFHCAYLNCVLDLYMKKLTESSRKIFFGSFSPFQFKNTLHVVLKWWFGSFWPISSNLLMLYCQVLSSMNTINCK